MHVQGLLNRNSVGAHGFFGRYVGYVEYLGSKGTAIKEPSLVNCQKEFFQNFSWFVGQIRLKVLPTCWSSRRWGKANSHSQVGNWFQNKGAPCLSSDHVKGTIELMRNHELWNTWVDKYLICYVWCLIRSIIGLQPATFGYVNSCSWLLAPRGVKMWTMNSWVSHIIWGMAVWVTNARLTSSCCLSWLMSTYLLFIKIGKNTGR